MLLTPKRRKYRKQMVKPIAGKASRGTKVSFGEFGLKAVTSGFVTNRQIEAARKVITRNIKKIGKLWIKIFPAVPLTKKGVEMPMGKGKGDVVKYAAAVRRGTVMFEITGLDRKTAEKVLLQAGKKLPVKCRIVAKGEIN